MKARYFVIVVTVCTLTLVGLCVLHIASPRVVAEATAPDGTQVCVVQQCNWSLEPFTTRFLYRHPNQTWGAFYFDHQDVYWGSARIDIDPINHVATVFRSGKRVMQFDWIDDIYTAFWPHLTRTMQGAQWLMTSDWRPGMSLRDIAGNGNSRHVGDMKANSEPNQTSRGDVQ